MNVTERCNYIDAMLVIAFNRADAIELLGVESEVGKAAHIFQCAPIRAFDWDEALKTGNAYYDRMVQLVPKYLGKMPVDQFSGVMPIYRRTEAGSLLYSVGPNMKDEDDRKDGKADDLAVIVDSTIDEPEP